MWNKKIGMILTSALLAFTTACGSSSTNSQGDSNSSAPQELVVAGYGGSFEKGMKETVIPAFEEKFNTKVTYVTGSSVDTLSKLQAQKDKPQIDVAIVDDGPQAMAKGFGLLAELEESKVPNLTDVYDVAKFDDKIGVGIGIVATGLAYNTEVFKQNGWEPPTSWNDLARPEFKGKLVLPSMANTYGVHMLVMAAKANGGDEKNIEPGFAKMKEIAANAVTFDKTADVSNFFLQGETVASAWGSGRVYTLKAKDFPIEFVYPKEGTVALVATGNVVKNAPNGDLAQEFINFLLSDEAQQTVAKAVFFGPVNKNVKLDDETAKMVVYGPGNIEKLITMDWKTINENRAAWTERTNKEIEVTK
jgi:putative spermidine/putrescine transport system substrate-binding protein